MAAIQHRVGFDLPILVFPGCRALPASHGTTRLVNSERLKRKPFAAWPLQGLLCRILYRLSLYVSLRHQGRARIPLAADVNVMPALQRDNGGPAKEGIMLWVE